MTSVADPSAPTRGFSRFVRDSVVYSTGTVVGKVAALMVLPIVTRTLGPSEYGELEVLSTLMSAMTSVLILGLDVAVTRVYPTLDDDARRRMFGSWMAIGVAITVPFALVMALGRGWISDLLFGYSELADEVALVGVFVVVTTARLMTLTSLRNQGRAGAFATITGGTLVVNSLLVVLLLNHEGSVRSVLLANVLSQTVGAIYGLWMTRRSVFGRPDGDLAGRVLRLGFPLVPAALALWVGEVLHRTILLGASSDAQVGFFGIAVRFASITLLVVVGFQTAWHPRAFAAARTSAGLEMIASDGRRILALVSVSAVLVALVAPEAVTAVGGSAFSGATAAVGWMLIFSMSFGVYQVVSIPSAIDKRMGDIGATGAAGTVVALGANLLLASRYGAAGTAFAMTLGQFAAIGLVLNLGRRRTVVPFALAPMVRLTTTAMVVVLVSTVGPDGLLPRAVAAVFFAAVVAADGSLPASIPRLRRARGLRAGSEPADESIRPS